MAAPPDPPDAPDPSPAARRFETRRHFLSLAAAIPALPAVLSACRDDAVARPATGAPTMPTKRPTQHRKLTELRHGPGFRAAGLRRDEAFDLDPFLNLDLFRMSQPTFPPHPHAGFSAVTYLLPESPGAFTNRDSLGDRSRIAPGDVHWTQAGRGMLHEEVPEATGVDGVGFQLFVDLSAADKSLPPRAFHGSTAALPRLRTDGAEVRVVAGSFEGATSPVGPLATDARLLDVTVEPGKRRALDFDAGLRTFLFTFGGRGVVNGRAVGPLEALLFDDDAGELELEGVEGTLRVLVGAGRPLRQPAVWRGPFCMTSDEEARDAYARFRRGEMGALAASF